MRVIAIVCGLLLWACCSLAGAHPGPTDPSGCHVDPKTGQYHCHPW